VHENIFSYVIMMESVMKSLRGADDFCVHIDKFITISGVLVSFVIPFSIIT
jgi:hypothetical protein